MKDLFSKLAKRWLRQLFWELVAKLLGFSGGKDQISLFGLAVPGPIAKKAADDAETPAVLSVREHGNNGGSEVKTYLKATGLGTGYPWCMAFCIYRLRNAAHQLLRPIRSDFPRSASTNVVANWGKKNGLFAPRAHVELGKFRPLRGDLVFFAFNGKIGHVGIVVEVTKTGVFTVEGNTGPDKNGKVEADGQGVYRKFRPWSQIGVNGGFLRLPF